MHIGFYAPFKPLAHPSPSGDLVIATGLHDYLQARGHRLSVLSTLRCRWIYWQPWRLAQAFSERLRLGRRLTRRPVDLWLTYHCYYKAPDLLGPAVTAKLDIPYLIFQGSYATKVRRKWLTRPGFELNRKALLAADMVLTNRRDDHVNLQRLLPEKRLGYIRPGIHPARFARDEEARREMRTAWQADGRPVILSAAMFRPDVKTEGLIRVIESCARLRDRGYDFLLVIAGEGRERKRLTNLAGNRLGKNVLLVGQVPRRQMARFYSGGDLFVFPGINESLGMVFLEAQSCRLPVVAFDNGGIPEVVMNGETGFLTPLFDQDAFDQAVATLLADKETRQRMGRRAAGYIREQHDLERNYRQLEKILDRVVAGHGQKR
ncbi:alpha-D-kanosaminyltransferase [bacterium BMS3Bbin14]|nr:alpha-D-kanosaminyltransferase [bacterium BMS3Bbin14]